MTAEKRPAIINNGFKSDSCFYMTYGDGDGTTFNPFDSLDVAGHEMIHGVTSRTANLTYSGESRGLNEATSNIFGTAVEFYANDLSYPNRTQGDPGDYLIGEKLYKINNGSTSPTKALRYMVQPSKDGHSADYWCSGLGSIDVHYSSGVAKHFFYLLAEGTTATSSKTCNRGDTRVASNSTRTLAGIGRAKAEKIWCRALTVYMNSSTNYSGARVATISAVNDLIGQSNSTFLATDAAAVAAAWAALNVPAL